MTAFGEGSLDEAMLRQRRVMVSGVLDERRGAEVTARLMYLDGLSPDSVELVVNAHGGTLHEAAMILDTLGLMRASVTVHVMGQAVGAVGVVVAANPGRRRLGSTGAVSLRQQPLPGAEGLGAAELVRHAEQADDFERRLAMLVAARSGQTIEWVRQEFERGAAYFGSDAVDAGLVDELR